MGRARPALWTRSRRTQCSKARLRRPNLTAGDATSAARASASGALSERERAVEQHERSGTAASTSKAIAPAAAAQLGVAKTSQRCCGGIGSRAVKGSQRRTSARARARRSPREPCGLPIGARPAQRAHQRRPGEPAEHERERSGEHAIAAVAPPASRARAPLLRRARRRPPRRPRPMRTARTRRTAQRS